MAIHQYPIVIHTMKQPQYIIFKLTEPLFLLSLPLLLLSWQLGTPLLLRQQSLRNYGLNGVLIVQILGSQRGIT